MGFNSLLFIPNDELSTIRRNPVDFADEVARSLGSLDHGRLWGRFHSFSAPYIAHADDIGLVAVGGNYAETIYQGFKGDHNHHTSEGQVELLERLAKSMGYSIKKDE